MNAFLVSGDRLHALLALTAIVQQRYGPVFEGLLPHMPTIVASYSPIHGLNISENLAEYAVTRVIAGENRVFLIYFVKDLDGVWRLDGM